MGIMRQSSKMHQGGSLVGFSRRYKVAVAEQDDEIRCSLVKGLNADGYDVMEAKSGFELLGQLADTLFEEVMADRPDAIIIDASLPGVSGLSILTGLRAANWSTPIVLITKDRQRNDEVNARLRADAVFEQPFDVDDLRTVVINIIPRAERALS